MPWRRPTRLKQLGLCVDVVVRVEMGGGPAHQAFEATDLGFDGGVATERPHRAIEPRMQPDAELRVSGGEGGRLLGATGPDHEARARHDPTPVRLDDPPIDARAGAEVIGVDDEIPHAIPTPGRTGSSRANQSSISASWSNPQCSPRATACAGAARQET